MIACKPSPLPYLSALLPMDCDASPDNSDVMSSNSQHLMDDAQPDAQTDADAIDNPYLLPPKIARWR